MAKSNYMIPLHYLFVNVQPRRRGCTVLSNGTVQFTATKVFNSQRPRCSTPPPYSRIIVSRLYNVLWKRKPIPYLNQSKGILLPMNRSSEWEFEKNGEIEPVARSFSASLAGKRTTCVFSQIIPIIKLIFVVLCGSRPKPWEFIAL